MHNLKVVIIGAGIGGLTAGIALRQAGYEVEIYDRVKELRPAGAGISLWSNGVKVLNRLGLGEKMAAIGGLMDRMQYLTPKGDVLNNIDLCPLVEEVGQRPYPVARTDLQQMLLEAYPGEVKLEHKCIEVQQDENGVTATFENGHRTTGDLLIAADGVRSLLRTYVLGEEVQPKYGYYVNWNGLVPASEDLAAKNSWVIYVGEHKRASMMPVAGDRFYFFFDVPLPKGTVSSPEDYRAELTEHFQGWAQPVQNLIQRLDPEDGLVLTQYLLTTNISIEYALQRYEADRKERTSAVVEKARKRAEMIHGKEPEITQKWYQQLAQEEPADVRGAIAKVILAGPLR